MGQQGWYEDGVESRGVTGSRAGWREALTDTCGGGGGGDGSSCATLERSPFVLHQYDSAWIHPRPPCIVCL